MEPKIIFKIMGIILIVTVTLAGISTLLLSHLKYRDNPDRDNPERYSRGLIFKISLLIFIVLGFAIGFFILNPEVFNTFTVKTKDFVENFKLDLNPLIYFGVCSLIALIWSIIYKINQPKD